MFKGAKTFLLLLMACCVWTNVHAQHAYEFDNKPAMNAYQDTLIRLAGETYSAKDNNERYASNARFIKTLVTALKTRNSFQYGFDSLKQVSVLKSPDNTFRIFSWQVPADDGTYRFFGSIQMVTKDGSLKLFPLIDATDDIKDVNEITDNKKWYGSKYYEIVPVVNSGKPTYYVLLGWKGNNSKTSKKVMEVLSFNNNMPVFGRSVFEGPKGTAVKNRIVFEYNKLNSMTLRLDKKAAMIVFDHLAPFDPSMEGNFEYYGSDSSFDGYKAAAGRLKLMENIELKNDPNAMDEFYTDPTLKNIPVAKKF